MALNLSISLSTDDCKNLIFKELTGAYDVTTNPGGWGAPNPLTSDSIGAAIVITTPSGTQYSFPLTSLSFPTTNINQQYIINYSSLGMSNGLVDGIYTIKYSVIITTRDGPVTYPVTIQTMIVCNLQCCIDSMLLDIDFDCDCSKDAQEDFLTAFAILQQIERSIECGDLDTAGDLVNMANKLCKNSNCLNCK